MISLGEYATVQEDKTILEALEALEESQRVLAGERHQHRAVLVLDDRGQVVGKLSHWAILRSLEPQFIKRDDLAALSRAGLSEDFIRSMEESYSLFTGSLEGMCRAAARVRARDAMVPVNQSIEENAPLSEAIRQLVLAHAQSTLVTRGDQVVGILRLSDVFEEIAGHIRGSECD